MTKRTANPDATTLYENGASVLYRLNNDLMVARQLLRYLERAFDALRKAKQDPEIARQGLGKAREVVKNLEGQIDTVERVQKQLALIEPAQGW